MTKDAPSALFDAARAQIAQIYPMAEIDALTARALKTFAPNAAGWRDEAKGHNEAIWSSEDAVLITYGNSIQDGSHKPLDLLQDFLIEHMEGVVNSVHILPYFPYTSDDGFAVTDFTKVDPALGDWPDIERIASTAKLMSDLVLNHVSSQSPWFNAYRQGQSPYDGFFFEASPEDDLSAVVRPRTTPLLQEIETTNGPRHVWCTFSHDQVDLNFANPEVLFEILRIIRMHIDKGVRIIRLDAVAFLWKEVGTSSIHLPQTHAVIKLFRTLIDYIEEPVLLITETNVPKAENLSYFGQSDEAHAIYNFPLPPLVLQAMLSGSAQYLRAWQATMPPAPKGCAYFNFTASHDGIGMRPAEGLLPPEEIERIFETIQEEGGLLSMRSGPDGSETVYEVNCSYFSAMARTHKGPDTHHIARFLASQTIVMSLEGIPGFYIHSILATPNDHASVAHRGMNRAINRHRWDYGALEKKLADPSADQAIVLKGFSERLKIRAAQPAFHPNATQFTLNVDNRVFGIWRQAQDRSQSIFALHNVSDEDVTVPCTDLNLIADESWVDLLSGETVTGDDISLAPYQCRWITNKL